MRVAAGFAGALLACSTSIASAAAPTPPVYREFGEWIVACDVTGACEARGFVDDGGEGLHARFRRDAGADAEPVLDIESLPASGGEIFVGTRRWRPTRSGALDWRSRDAQADEPRVRIRGIDAVREFVVAAQAAESFRIAAETGTLVGFNAAMLFVDDVQGRVGTPGALARPGSSKARIPAPKPLPAAPAAGRVREITGEAARRYTSAIAIPADTCDPALRHESSQLYDIGGGEVLALILCWRGPYQAASALYRGPGARPSAARPVLLPFPAGLSGPDEDGHVLFADFEPATARLSSFGKGRGIGDYGEAATWIFDGREFRLVHFAMLARPGWHLPGDFPVLWRTAAPRGARP
ncbi:DUF1176 domain-containing protein [Lysobacter humi (ex Lee et al. 2017)]